MGASPLSPRTERNQLYKKTRSRSAPLPSRKKNLSPQTIYHCLSLLRRVLYTAKEYELSDTKLPSFPMPKVKNQRYRFLSIDEANMLIACLSNRKFFSSMLWRDLTVLSLNTGLRPNELFNLRRCHISLKNNICG